MTIQEIKMQLESFNLGVEVKLVASPLQKARTFEILLGLRYEKYKRANLDFAEILTREGILKDNNIVVTPKTPTRVIVDKKFVGLLIGGNCQDTCRIIFFVRHC